LENGCVEDREGAGKIKLRWILRGRDVNVSGSSQCPKQALVLVVFNLQVLLPESWFWPFSSYISINVTTFLFLYYSDTEG